MARITTVNKSMKDQKCGRCGTELPKGSAYRWAKPGFRSRTRLIRCMDSACNFRASELTQSKLSGVYAAQENLQDAIDGWGREDRSDLESALSDAADEAEAVAEEYREASQNWGDSGNEEWDQMADQIDEWVEALRDVDLDEWDEDGAKSELADDGYDWDTDPDDLDEELIAARDTWADEQVTKVQDACDEMGV